MSEHKYTNYGSKFNQTDTKPAVDAAIPAAEAIDQEVNEELGMFLGGTTLLDSGIGIIEDSNPPAEPKTGIVTANRLNIRKAPSKGAEVVTIVDKDTVLMIDPEHESIEWLKVCTATGIEGYCMKKFVEVK